MKYASLALSLAALILVPTCLQSQSTSSSSERLQVAPQVIGNATSIDLHASAEELEKHGDEFRGAKQFADALEYYRAAMSKKPQNAVLYNKMGICELLWQHFRSAHSDFEHAFEIDRRFAAAYNNLGVVNYAVKKYGKAIKAYERAISIEPDGALYYSNLGAAHFSKKEWEKATQAYSRAVSLNPDVFEQKSGPGIAGQIASPADRAHFSYVLAKLYARSGMTDRSLECLRRAMEEGYKGVNAVYSDGDFSSLRKDPRFAQLMSERPVSIPE